MHPEPYELIKSTKERYPEYFKGKKVLEVGSLDINGSPRDFFEECDYTGIDLGPGSGVDKIIPIANLLEPNTYDVVVSTEMLEHDKDWKQSLHQMVTNLKIGGLFIFSCAGPTRQEHGTKRTTPEASPYTPEYYRNISIEDFWDAIPHTFFIPYQIDYKRGKADLLFWGIKSA